MNKVPFHEKIIFTKEQRCLNNYKSHQKRWKKTIKFVCKYANKSIENSVIFRSEKHRQKIEVQQALDLAKPLHQKFGNQLWITNLRHYKGSYFKDYCFGDIPRCFSLAKIVNSTRGIEHIKMDETL